MSKDRIGLLVLSFLMAVLVWYYVNFHIIR